MAIKLLLSSSLLAELDIKNLTNELATVAHKWFNIGIQLEIDYHVLKGFEQQHKDNPSRCLSEMLHCWLNGNGKSCVKWETIIEVLRSPSINETGLAEKIFEDNHSTPTQGIVIDLPCYGCLLGPLGAAQRAGNNSSIL